MNLIKSEIKVAISKYLNAKKAAGYDLIITNLEGTTEIGYKLLHSIIRYYTENRLLFTAMESVSNNYDYKTK